MKAFLVNLLILLSVILFSCNSEEEIIWPQLLSNPSVEEGRDMPNSWMVQVSDGTGMEWAWSDTEAFSGNKSLTFSNTPEDTLVYGIWGQEYSGEIPIGKDIELSLMVKGENIEGNGVAIIIKAVDKSLPAAEWQQVFSNSSEEIKGTFDWKKYSYRIDELKPGVELIGVYLFLMSNSQGQVYFDDIRIDVLD